MVTWCPKFVQACAAASSPQNVWTRRTIEVTVHTTYLMMVTNCDMVISWGTKNFDLSLWGRLISLRNLSTMTWNHKRKSDEAAWQNSTDAVTSRTLYCKEKKGNFHSLFNSVVSVSQHQMAGWLIGNYLPGGAEEMNETLKIAGIPGRDMNWPAQ
jgi:hypothetical protein